MPRIFRARPAPPVGRSIDIGVTMHPVGARPAQVASAINAEPAYVGFRYTDETLYVTALPPGNGSYANDENTAYFIFDFMGIKETDDVTWDAEYIDGDVAGTATAPASGQSFAGLIGFTIEEVGSANFRITCTVNGVAYSETWTETRV